MYELTVHVNYCLKVHVLESILLFSDSVRGTRVPGYGTLDSTAQGKAWGKVRTGYAYSCASQSSQDPSSKTDSIVAPAGILVHGSRDYPVPTGL